MPASLQPRGQLNHPQLESFPRVAVANDIFKNQRNVTLVDLDGRPGEEVLWMADDKLIATAFDGNLWTRQLSGTGLYPPSVADLDGDGEVEIVQATGGYQAGGRIYVLDVEGNILPGWPFRFNDPLFRTAPCLADIDGDGTLEILVNGLQWEDGLVYVFRKNGNVFSGNWPVLLDHRPAVTPTVGDMDGDGLMEIVAFSQESRYMLDMNGQILPGWPQVTAPEQVYLQQSPIMAKLGEGEGLSLVGATHGGEEESQMPYFYVLDKQGSFRPGWPIPVPHNADTFTSPTVVNLPGVGMAIFVSRPLPNGVSDDMLYGFDASGQMLPGFPIVKVGGLDGFISVADVDGDDFHDLVFGSEVVDASYSGFIHAYHMDDGDVSELPGFPIRTRGYTYMNGANFGDVDGDGRLDLVALSWVFYQGIVPDSLYLNVYPLGVTIKEHTVLWGTFKGDNSRQGLAKGGIFTPVHQPVLAGLSITISPNPVHDKVNLRGILDRPLSLSLALVDVQGKVYSLRNRDFSKGDFYEAFSVNNIPPGTYWIHVRHEGKTVRSLPFIRY